MISLRRLSVLFVVPLIGLSAVACGSDEAETPKSDSATCSYSEDGAAAKPAELPPGEPEKDAPKEVTIGTDQGDVKISLEPDKAPCTVNSFLSLAKQGYFDNTVCHRLTDQGIFVLQCGDPSASGSGGPGYSFDDELVENDARLQPCQVDAASGTEVCTYTAGTVAMANAGPDTNGSQFFLVYKDSPLPAAYTAFGRMSAAGLKVVQKVAAAGAQAPDATGNTAPKQPVTITSVK